MENPQSLRHDPFGTPFDQPDERGERDIREEWEDWDEEDLLGSPSTPLEAVKEEPLLSLGTDSPSKSKSKAARRSEARATVAQRYSIQKPSRLKSRARQKAQNAKAGIKLVTDMSKFRKQQHVAHQLKSATEPDGRTGKFVDAAALRALEGTPTDASVGSWHWLKRKPTNKRGTKSPLQGGPDLSPADRPIVIGIALPEDDAASRVISPQTAAVETPLDLRRYLPGGKASQKQQTRASPATPQIQPRSVWSPDTDDGSPFSASGASPGASSLTGIFMSRGGDVPPVPSLPSNYVGQQRRVESVELDDDDFGTPVTLFEEDGSPVGSTKSPVKTKGHSRSPATVGTRSGWWDHVQTPFTEHQSPFTAKSKSPGAEEVEARDEWWNTSPDESKAAAPKIPELVVSTAAANAIRDHSTGQTSPTVASSSRTVAPDQEQQRPETHFQKAQILVEENNQTPAELPPPYEPPSKERMVRYRAVFPPGHPLRAHFPPSPGPISPGLASTMTSQGAISMTNVPLTPATQRTATGAIDPALPDRPRGTYFPGVRFASPMGNSRAAKIERTRRRHEKEDVLARRTEGFWKGRGCIPQNGCYGRRGREGRQRRRVYLGIFAGVLAVIILIVVLAVTLTHRTVIAPSTPYSFWLNLTDFPPIPTGVTTVVGPENSEIVAGCVNPPTLWSCSLPKEEQAANQPYQPQQPEFILQIQFDNNTRQLWNVPDGPIPTPTSTPDGQPLVSAPAGNSSSTSSNANSNLSRRHVAPPGMLERLRRASPVRREADPTQVFDTGFSPQPTPPAFHEMWFLGNTTDDIVSDRKAGEPTPFYITMLRSLNDTVGANALSRRQIGNGITPGPNGNVSSLFPPPALNPDGTGAPAMMRPYPVQQPLRLFDRGLPTEHYGFYSYFNKTIYVQSITRNLTSDDDGGSLEADSNFFVTWTQTRFLVQIWTRMGNNTRLLGPSAAAAAAATSGNGSSNTTQPGTFPYPITVTEDLHGGDHNLKGQFAREVDAQQRILADNGTEVIANLAFGGTLINHNADPSWGGVDGGTGGCRCAWTNFIGLNGNTLGAR